MTKKLNIVVIGCSGMAQRHMQGVLDNGANLYGICDISEERIAPRLAEFEGVKTTTDYREYVTDPNVDAAVIVTPDKLHKQMTIDFLMAGKDVLCEKPMALTLDECRDMIDAEKKSGKKLMIGQVCRCTPSFIMTKNLIDEGRIGELFFVESEYAHDYAVARGADDWRVDPDRHGIIGGGCHAIDLLRWIAGNPTEVYALSNHKCLTDWPVDDCTVALFKFPNDVKGKVFTSIGCKRNYTMRSVFYGTKGTIICDNTSSCIWLYEDGEKWEDGKRRYTRAIELPVEVNNHNITAEIDMFVKALQSGKEMPVTSKEGANTVAVCCACVESSKKDKPIKIEYVK